LTLTRPRGQDQGVDLSEILSTAALFAGVGTVIWGMATNWRGRQAVDEQHASKLSALRGQAEGHAASCDDRHDATRGRHEDLERRLAVAEVKITSLERDR
jgi:hypothetical protein